MNLQRKVPHSNIYPEYRHLSSSTPWIVFDNDPSPKPKRASVGFRPHPFRPHPLS